MVPKYIIVHHTAVSYDKNQDQFHATNRYHQSKDFPRSSIGYYVGYHYEIAKDGTLYQARDDNEAGAHTSQQSMNYSSIGIALDGDFDKEDPTDKQIETLKNLLRDKMSKMNIDASHVVPHRKFAPKTCWGSRLPDDILGYIKSRTIATIPTVSPWAIESVEKAKKKGLIVNWSNPKGEVSDETYQWVFKKLGALETITTEALTREKFAVILDRLHLLD